jgi:hypothetical protein
MSSSTASASRRSEVIGVPTSVPCARSRERLLRLALRSRTHAWPVEMLVAASRAGLRVKEVPVDARRRMGGRSKVAGSVRGSAKAGVRLLGALLRS